MIPQLIKETITKKKIVEGESRKEWKETFRPLIMPHVNYSCVFGCDMIKPNWCMNLLVIILLGESG
jgi:hypothetical protein